MNPQNFSSNFQVDCSALQQEFNRLTGNIEAWSSLKRVSMLAAELGLFLGLPLQASLIFSEARLRVRSAASYLNKINIILLPTKYY